MAKEKIAGIIAEFNPFHSGHEYLIKQARALGFDKIAVIMSGNFTQRGEAACLSKKARVKTALLCGADIVFELPLPYAVSSAENFAFGAVSLLNSLGAIDALVFGSENENTEALIECAKKVLELNNTEALSNELSKGISYPKAIENALGKKYSHIISNPNSTLAVEYIKSILKLNSKIKPIAVKREGAGHDEEAFIKDGVPTASASAIRTMLSSTTPLEALKFLPKKSAEILKDEIDNGYAPYNKELSSRLMLDKLRRMSAEDFKVLPYVSEGLENRLFIASQKATSFDEFLMLVKSKRYTLARIRRIAISAYLDIDKSYTQSPLPYLRVLGFNGSGVKLLAKAKKSADLPIISRYSDIKQLSSFANRLFMLESKASDLYSLALPNIRPCSLEQTFKPITYLD